MAPTNNSQRLDEMAKALHFLGHRTVPADGSVGLGMAQVAVMYNPVLVDVLNYMQERDHMAEPKGWGVVYRLLKNPEAVGYIPSRVGASQKQFDRAVDVVEILVKWESETLSPEVVEKIRNEVKYRLRTMAAHAKISGRVGVSISQEFMDTEIESMTENLLGVARDLRDNS